MERFKPFNTPELQFALRFADYQAFFGKELRCSN